MAFGATAPMPLRLGGFSEEGWSAQEFSRFTADLVATQRAAPLAVLTVNKSGATVTVESYHGQNGVGAAHAPAATSLGAGIFELEWETSYRGPQWVSVTREDQTFSWRPRHALVYGCGSAPILAHAVFDSSTGLLTVRTTNVSTSTLTDARTVIEVYGDWLPQAQIGTYGGDPNKENSSTEGEVPYASLLYRMIQGMRGSGFTTKPNTLVHAENITLARFWGYFSMRLPEKVRANEIPARSEERLGYWTNVLGVPVRPREEKWQTRQKCAVAFKTGTGPNYETVLAAIQELLGDVFVELYLQTEDPLSTPPSGTAWPAGNPGPASYSIGGGAWFSPRAHLVIQVQRPSDRDIPSFLRLVNVDLFRMLDDLLPAWMTFSWTTGTEFYLDVSHLDYDGLSDP